jgi:hypothetical protein
MLLHVSAHQRHHQGAHTILTSYLSVYVTERIMEYRVKQIQLVILHYGCLFYILASTCFGSSLPSSGSCLDPSELLEIQIRWVLYHIMCGYVACGHITTHYCCGRAVLRILSVCL